MWTGVNWLEFCSRKRLPQIKENCLTTESHPSGFICDLLERIMTVWIKWAVATLSQVDSMGNILSKNEGRKRVNYDVIHELVSTLKFTSA
jgi:hypothetical protein